MLIIYTKNNIQKFYWSLYFCVSGASDSLIVHDKIFRRTYKFGSCAYSDELVNALIYGVDETELHNVFEKSFCDRSKEIIEQMIYIGAIE